MKILIIKTSSLGDIIQALPTLSLLKKEFPEATIDWVVEKSFIELLEAHSLVSRVIPIETKRWKKSPFSPRTWRAIFQTISSFRGVSYDYIFDLQGNTKSGLITYFARGKEKIGYNFKTAPEWPNPLFLTHRYPAEKREPMTQQYLLLIERHFSLAHSKIDPIFQLRITKEEEDWIETKCVKLAKIPFMVCLGSNWENKKISPATWRIFLEAVEIKADPYFFFIWGNEKEREEVEALCSHFPNCSEVVPKMRVPVWQNLISKMGAVISVDSSALHLTATTKTPSFSLFGPSSSKVYKPQGEHHVAFQGKCPYRTSFEKRCPYLRTCATGACLKEVPITDLLTSFCDWYNQLRLFNIIGTN